MKDFGRWGGGGGDAVLISVVITNVTTHDPACADDRGQNANMFMRHDDDGYGDGDGGGEDGDESVGMTGAIYCERVGLL